MVSNFIPHSSDSARIFKPDIEGTTTLHINACLTGVGGIWNKVYCAPVPTFIEFYPNITHLEMISVLITLRILAKFWASSSVVFHCANWAIAQVVASGKTKGRFLNACIKHIWLVTAIFDIGLHIKHVEEAKNVLAD